MTQPVCAAIHLNYSNVCHTLLKKHIPHTFIKKHTSHMQTHTYTYNYMHNTHNKYTHVYVDTHHAYRQKHAPPHQQSGGQVTKKTAEERLSQHQVFPVWIKK